MDIKICKWFNDADSPVMFMIDDLANTWVDMNRNGQVEPGEDWGYFKDHEHSSFRYLERQLLSPFPDVKVTFFVPVGVRSGIIKQPLFKQISKPINADEESRRFFSFIHSHPRFELAYHGTTHGQAGEKAEDFIQEWDSFSNVEDAVQRTEQGIETFKDAVGVRPQGGKYCGYVSNRYSDDSIDATGFLWWCRYWNRGVLERNSGDISGRDFDKRSNFDVKRFGKNDVVDIPSTVNGEMLNSLYRPGKTFKGLVKRILKEPLIRMKLREIDFLLKHKLVISIQEHIAPARDDGKRQNPNIFDDRQSLTHIFRYLQKKKVWYCTGTELAVYVNTRDKVNIVVQDGRTFRLEYDPCPHHQMITLRFKQKRGSVLLPDQTSVNITNGIANLKVMDGNYMVIESATKT
ncbi:MULTISPECIES: hypothetical protein [Paenibacillus]|uniref:DUF2334 domain-containing protein n=1 Tax=Paenibacillus albilobatus TaxID=2716884 RepID=A0A919XFQ9_9BACL|nr:MULTISPECIES: hypothetical protein [Paenibacillus]GIO30135.1 hypothetical protein J2TS6_12760 [Paenibacillus albilobatus]